MTENTVKKDLLEKYQSNRVIRGLIQLVPYGIGSSIDTILIQTIEKMKRERGKVFFDELAKGNVLVDESLLESEDFLHCFFSTTKYAMNSRRQEKIRMFARLLKSSITEDSLKNVDEYEDFLKILDELNYREIQALVILDEFSERPKINGKNEAQWTATFWGEFASRLEIELMIPPGEVTSFLNKITRTGCYEAFYFLWGGGDTGKLTDTYYRLKQYIFEKAENC